ncbi:MAG: hypothetical protein VX777_04205 [Chlamydiota bacterium]|nr:hypothetical protein [Chlamydiota bacterium]
MITTNNLRQHLYEKNFQKAENLYKENQTKEKNAYSKHMNRIVRIYGKQSGIGNKILITFLKSINFFRSWFGISDWQLARKNITKNVTDKFTQVNLYVNLFEGWLKDSDYVGCQAEKIFTAVKRNFEASTKNIIKQVADTQLQIIQKATYIKAKSPEELDAKIKDLASRKLSLLYDQVVDKNVTKALKEIKTPKQLMDSYSTELKYYWKEYPAFKQKIFTAFNPL